MSLVSRCHLLKFEEVLREKCPYSELFWSVFSNIRTEYGEIRSIYGQNNSEYEHFLRSENTAVVFRYVLKQTSPGKLACS